VVELGRGRRVGMLGVVVRAVFFFFFNIDLRGCPVVVGVVVVAVVAVICSWDGSCG
jgi:hypothetical protein